MTLEQVAMYSARSKRTTMSILIFHSPRPIDRPLASGSAVRPRRMLDAFRSIGQEVVVVDGDSRSRKRLWREAVAWPADRIAGVYSELATTPIALTDPDHLPRSPFMDFQRMHDLKRKGVPVSVYYRDLYWRFSQFAHTASLWKRVVARPFYHLEIHQLGRCADLVFVPSLGMSHHIPFGRVRPPMIALPPGCVERSRTLDANHSTLRLLYVGGVGPPNYDLSVMLDAVRGLESCELRICCRVQEWDAISSRYQVPPNVTVHHAMGSELDAFFLWADALFFWSPTNVYLRFAMPIKVFESMGWGLPVIVNGDTEFGRFVRETGVGWSPSRAEELGTLLARIRDDRSELARRAAVAARVRQDHTWEARARTVLATFRSIRDRAL